MAQVSAGCALAAVNQSPPALTLLPELQARLTCVFVTADCLIPSADRQAICDALCRADPASQRLWFVECAGVHHGLMCEARSSFDPQASAQGWRPLLGDELLV